MKMSFIFTACFCFLLLSCSQEIETYPVEQSSVNDETEEVVVLNTWDELIDFLGIENQEVTFSDEIINTKASIDNFTIYGYDSVETTKSNYKTAFGGTLAADMGVLPSQIWIADFYTVHKKVIYTGNGYVVPQASPNCGYMPQGTGATKGYASSVNGTQFNMFTLTICIKYDMTGRSYFNYYPRNHSNLEWNYSIINM